MTEGTLAAGALEAPGGVEVSEHNVRRLLLGTWRGRFGLSVLGLFVFMAIFGSAIAAGVGFGNAAA